MTSSSSSSNTTNIPILPAAAAKQPVSIAPAPPKPAEAAAPSLPPAAAAAGAAPTSMPFVCQTCTRRKIRCDRLIPVCSACRRGKLDCVYHAPAPRQRKRKSSFGGGGGAADGGGVHERLARYEAILARNGLLPADAGEASGKDSGLHQEGGSEEEPISLRWTESETSRTGRVVFDAEGRSRYIDSHVWRSLEADGLSDGQDEAEQDDAVAGGEAEGLEADPLTEAFLPAHQQVRREGLLALHPSHEESMALWRIHTENVEPLCKVLHVPTTERMVESVSRQPETASRAEECLLFAVYHFAVFSVSEEECAACFEQPRTVLMNRYRFATRQALVNSFFLRSTDMTVLQALVLLLLATRYHYDPHTYWILTGVTVRVAQRMGLHRDGEKQGLPPFELQMARRVFNQIVPLDGIASQMTGTGIAIMPDTWDTKPPLNVNDDQIWPGMAEMPVEQQGATEMIFCLTRASVGMIFAQAGTLGRNPSRQFRSVEDVDVLICKAEREVEERFIRYCDIINPLHLLTIGLARSAINAMRLRARLPKARTNTATRAERLEIFQIALRIMDTDIAAYANPSVRRFLWHVKPFFAWGSWDSLVFILTTLRKADLFSSADVEAAWARMERVFTNHSEIMEPKAALQVAIGRMAVKAWDGSPSSRYSSGEDPAFISTLRALRKTRSKKGARGTGADDAVAETKAETTGSSSSDDPLSSSDLDALLTGLDDNMGCNLGDQSSFDMDWMYWDKLIEDYQAHPG